MATKTQRGRSAPKHSQERSTETRRREPAAAQRAERAQTATVRLPFVTAEFRRPDVHLPSTDEVTGAVSTAYENVRENLPPREELAYYGGLAALAVFSVIEWPVAAAIGVGTAIAHRGVRGSTGGRSRSATATA